MSIGRKKKRGNLPGGGRGEGHDLSGATFSFIHFTPPFLRSRSIGGGGKKKKEKKPTRLLPGYCTDRPDRKGKISPRGGGSRGAEVSIYSHFFLLRSRCNWKKKREERDSSSFQLVLIPTAADKKKFPRKRVPGKRLVFHEVTRYLPGRGERKKKKTFKKKSSN